MVASVLVPASLFALAAVRSRSDTLRVAEASIARTVAVMNEHARKVFETEELVLGRVDDRVRALTWDQIAAPEMSTFLAQLKAPLEQAVSIWVADAQGVVRAGSRPWDPTVPIAERDFFQTQRERDAGTYLSKAFVGKATGTASFAVSRRRSTSDGHFDGTVHIALSPEYFARFFSTVEPDQTHAALLVREDGIILARDPSRELNLPLSPDSPLMRAIAQHPEGSAFTAVSSLDGVERMNAFRKVATYPVYVVLGVDTTSILRPWHEGLLLSGAATGAASMLLLMMSWLALRGVKAEQVAMTRLRTTMEELQRETAQREAAEQRMREAQKMEAVGQLTGGIAHDFNNLLTAVLGSLHLLRKRLPKGDEGAGRLVDNAVQGAQRGAALTQRLLAFGRRQLLEPEAVDLPTLVRGLADLLRSSLGAGVQVETRFPISLAPAHVDANQLELAVLNLAVNARDAMAGAGRLVIAGREEPAGSGGPDGIMRAYVVLSVTDSGTGMDEATLARAMEPFFTTKGIGKGTGLGLSMVHGLAAQSGGRLMLHSQVGVGTTAELWLPRAEIAPMMTWLPTKAEQPRPLPAPKRRSVLLVDDDPLVLTSTASMLEDIGHDVVEAASGKQALEILRAGAKVDLVVTDYAMPGMTGVQLAADLHQDQPMLPVLLATGYAETVEAARAGLPLLAKPFDQAALAEAVGKCLESFRNTHGHVIPFRMH
jgi:signal transduction histidine kinase/CheY-like chemotaxis protein